MYPTLARGPEGAAAVDNEAVDNEAVDNEIDDALASSRDIHTTTLDLRARTRMADWPSYL